MQIYREKIANSEDRKEKGYRTYNQWLELGYLPLQDHPGTLMYSNGYRLRKLLYWSADEVYPATTEELKAARDEIRRKRNARRSELRQKRKEAEQLEQEILRKQEERETSIRQIKQLLKEASSLSPVPYNNPSKIVVFDLETTGLDPCEDEILQIALIDGDGKTLLDTLVKPYFHTGWCDAEMIHGISPTMVADKPQLHELIPVIKGIFDSADLVVSFNGLSFDMAFLETAGINISHIPHYDVMLEFAPIYGEWDDYHGSYKWQSLSTCAAHYDYCFQAHNALEDCRATLHCYKAITKENIL